MPGDKCVAIDARMIEFSGIGTYIRMLLQSSVYDYAIGNPDLIHRYNSTIPVIAFDAKIYGLKEQLSYPIKELKKAGVTTVHFPHYNVPMFFPLPYVVTIHDLIHIVFPEFMKNRVAASYARVLMKTAANHAQRVLTDSNSTKDDLEQYLHVQPEKIHVVPLAVDPVFGVKNDINEAKLRKKLHIPETKKILLYVGNIRPHKNIPFFLRAFSKSSHKNETVIVLAGRSTIDETIQTLEASLSIQNNVVHTGLISEEDLIDLYNIAYGFVFPSLYEGYGLPPLEAMACGTPVICSNSSSLPEVVGDGALLFDPHNEAQLVSCIDRLISDDALRAELIQKGFRQVNNISMEAFIQSTKNLLK